jgi:hypothetical protein
MTARTLFSIVIGASLIASAALAGAQGGPPPGAQKMGGPGGPGGGGRGAMMQKLMDDEFKKLHVTPGQKKKIDGYMAHSRRAMEAYRKAHPNEDRSAMRPVMEKSRAERTAFLKKTLTAKQYKQYEEDMKAMRAKMGGGRRGGGPGGPPGGGRGGPGGPPPGR